MEEEKINLKALCELCFSGKSFWGHILQRMQRILFAFRNQDVVRFVTEKVLRLSAAITALLFQESLLKEEYVLSAGR